MPFMEEIQMKIFLIITVLQLSFILPGFSQTTIGFQELSSIDSKNAFSIETYVHDVTNIGDINGDGIGDLIVVPSSRIYVLYGRAESFGNVNPSWSDNTSFHGLRIFLDLSLIVAPLSVSSFGDFNKDGINDIIIIISPGISSSEIKAIVIYGKDREENALILESNLSKADGFKIFAMKQNNYVVTSYSVIRTGDINNDGIDDGLIRIQQREDSYNGQKTGMFYTVYGNTSIFEDINLETLSNSSKFRIYDKDVNEMLPIQWIGDINHDGVQDFATRSSAGGELYVIYGRIGGLSDMNITTISNTQGFRIKYRGPYYMTNYYYQYAGDLNGDGIDDLVIGDEKRSPFEPVYIIYGKISNFSDIVLEDLTPSDGFKITCSNGKEGLGLPTQIGDVNNDGFDDILIFSKGYSTEFDKGYFIFGQKDRRPNIDITAAEVMLAIKHEGGFNPTGGRAGDLNGDGIDEIVIKTNSRVYGLYGSDCDEYSDCSSPMPSICYTSKGCTCRNKNMIMQDLSCVSSCSPGYYQAPDSTCKICSENCKVCSSNPVCEACFDGYLLQDSVCVRSCSGGYLIQGSSCVSSCSNGYFLQGLLCVSSCSHGYVRQDSLCLSSCSDGFFIQDSLCVSSCSEGYLRQDSSCVNPRLNGNLIQESSSVSSQSIGVIIGAIVGAVAAVIIVIMVIIYIIKRKRHEDRIPFPAVRFESEMEIKTSTTPVSSGKYSYLEHPIERTPDNNDHNSMYAVREEEKEDSNGVEGVGVNDQHQVEYEFRIRRAE